MKLITKSTLILVGIMLAEILFYSCGKFCDDVKYFDFKTAEVYLFKNQITSTDTLHFRIYTETRTYMALQQNFSFFNTAYAISCDEGWAGMLYPIRKIEITSNADFDDNHKANTLLNDLVTINAVTDDDGRAIYEYMTLAECDISKSMGDNSYVSDFYIIKIPTHSKEHTLTIKLFKENGEVVTTQSPMITWK